MSMVSKFKGMFLPVSILMRYIYNTPWKGMEKKGDTFTLMKD